MKMTLYFFLSRLSRLLINLASHFRILAINIEYYSLIFQIKAIRNSRMPSDQKNELTQHLINEYIRKV